MWFNRENEDQLGLLAEQVRQAQAVTPDLVSGLAETCTRIKALGRVQARPRIDRLIASEAWTDAALALIELELPLWKLRRLLYEDGEWHCCLSRQPELPAWIDETVEVHHEVLPLAILNAFVEARQVVATAREVGRTVPLVAPERCQPICCDNFA
jgi:hypothetical protein